MIWMLPAAGAAFDAINAFYSTKSAQAQAESGALNAEMEASLANVNARAAEADAGLALEAGRRAAAFTGLRYGQEKAGARVSAAARGVQGSGSTAEALASIEFAKQADMWAIDTNASREANAARTRAVDQRNRALLARTSANNLRRMRGAMDPLRNAGASLLGSGLRYGSQYALFNSGTGGR